MGNGGAGTEEASEAFEQNDADAQAANGQKFPGSGAIFDVNGTGGFSNMAFGAAGDFNQMQMMMAMHNGMGANGFGNFPMMGMSQQLYLPMVRS